MFQLILGISLLVFLLFVISLMMTEVGVSPPMRICYENNWLMRAYDLLFKSASEQNRVRFLLLVLSCILALSMAALFISHAASGEAPTAYKTKKTVPGSASSARRTFTDSLPEYALAFTTDTKWEAEKIYINQGVHFSGRPVWNFRDWTFHLLDKDGFLISKFAMSPKDFIFQINPGGRIVGLLAQTNALLSFEDYRRITRIQVILDKRMTVK